MKVIRLIFILILITPPVLSAQESSEYHLKAAYIERFCRFITWPENVTLSNPITIGIVGDGDAFLEMKKFFETMKIADHPVEVINIVDDKLLYSCNIIFISQTESMKELYAKLDQNSSILTIADLPEMAQEGAMIAFFILNGKLKFCINPDEISKSGFKVSSFLLKMATIVSTSEKDSL